MLKKVILVATLAVASLVSANLVAHKTSAAASAPVAAMWPPPDCWQTGSCVN